MLGVERPKVLISGLADGDVISGINKLYEVILTPGTANSSATLSWTDSDGESKTITLRGIANGANVSAPRFGGPVCIRNQNVTVALSGTAAALAIYTSERLTVTQAQPTPGPRIAGTANLVSRATALKESTAAFVTCATNSSVLSFSAVALITVLAVSRAPMPGTTTLL